MKLFLHIGTRKAGSSLIQNFCQLNKGKLLGLGYFYPDNNNFGERKGKSPGHWRLHKIFEGREDFILEDYLPSSCAAENVIFSNEALTTEHCDIFNMPEKARDFLTKKFQVKVVIYLRRQDLYTSSLYNEGILSGNHKSIWTFDEFLKQNQLPELEYYKLVKSWSNAFGKKNIVIRPFEKGQFDENDLIKDFLNCIGLQWHDDFILPDEKSKNSSPDITLVEAVRVLNRIPLQLRPMYRDFLDNVFDELVFEGKQCAKTKKNFIPPAKRVEILERYAESNAKVAREFLGHEDGKLFYDPEPQKDEPWEPVSVNDPDLIVRLFSLFLEQKSAEIQNFISSQGKRLDKHQNYIDRCDKRLIIHQNQIDLGRQTQEINNNKVETLRKNAWQGVKEIKQTRNFLFRHVLATYKRARKNPWKRLCRLLRSPRMNEAKFLRDSGLVDPHYYFENYPHAISSGITAAEHYVRYGAQQGNNISPQFNTVQYLAKYPDAAHDGINPLVHFILKRRGALKR